MRFLVSKPTTIAFACIALAMMTLAAFARSPLTDARAGIAAFSGNCFSPFLTAEKAAENFGYANIRYDFYDLDPFSNVAPSPAKGRASTPETDRRCEVSFNGDYTADAITAVVATLLHEGITTPAALPATHKNLRTDGTALLSARRLNQKKIAVVHVGTRPLAQGVETFLNVERLRSPELQ